MTNFWTTEDRGRFYYQKKSCCFSGKFPASHDEASDEAKDESHHPSLYESSKCLQTMSTDDTNDDSDDSSSEASNDSSDKVSDNIFVGRRELEVDIYYFESGQTVVYANGDLLLTTG